MLGGAAHKRRHEHTRLGAASVSKKRIGLNLAAIPPMGLASLSPSVGAAVDWCDQPARMQHSTRRLGARMLRRPVNRLGEAIFGHHGRDDDEARRTRRELVAAISSVALRDGANSWRSRLGHELSHHIGGRGGGQGCNVP